MDKKGQLSIQDAPNIILLVGLTFLIMVTIAYVSNAYGTSMSPGEQGFREEETLTTVTENGERVFAHTICGFSNFAIKGITNGSDAKSVVGVGNWTYDAEGWVYFDDTDGDPGVNNTDWYINYSYNYIGIGCNVTEALETEISDNTSIAGMVLTISLVGIVLAVLIGIFVVARGRRI